MDMLKRPQGIVPVVLDTDAYNEVDDQFAIAYLLRSPEKVDLQAIYAAPFYDKERCFHNFRSESAGEGMKKSYEEIKKLLRLAGREELLPNVYPGSEQFLGEDSAAVDSPAARDLIRRAMGHTSEFPLYVLAIGAPTNVASALLLEPAIRERVVVIWLGGNVLDWPSCREFNLSQDLAASKVLFEADVNLILVPCMGMASAFAVTPGELKRYFAGRNPLCDYLAKTVLEDMGDPKGEKLWSRILWDVTACAWLMGEQLALDRREKKPIPTDTVYLRPEDGPQMGYVYYVNRDGLLRDLAEKLRGENYQ